MHDRRKFTRSDAPNPVRISLFARMMWPASQDGETRNGGCPHGYAAQKRRRQRMDRRTHPDVLRGHRHSPLDRPAGRRSLCGRGMFDDLPVAAFRGPAHPAGVLPSASMGRRSRSNSAATAEAV